MTIRCRQSLKRMAFAGAAFSLIAVSGGCNVARNMTTDRMNIGTSEPARVHAQAKPYQTVATTEPTRQRMLLVAGDNLGSRIFPDAGMPTAAEANTAYATVPTDEK